MESCAPEARKMRLDGRKLITTTRGRYVIINGMQDTREGEVIFSLPLDIVLVHKSTEQNFTSTLGENLDEFTAMTVKLLRERNKAHASPLYPYIKVGTLSPLFLSCKYPSHVTFIMLVPKTGRASSVLAYSHVRNITERMSKSVEAQAMALWARGWLGNEHDLLAGAPKSSAQPVRGLP